ncbi:hypothetical protein C6Y62_15800 [Hyphomicrobium sulfonivorans]|nr:hypothetical protein [Hyphomicrobium sulfonivorans]
MRRAKIYVRADNAECSRKTPKGDESFNQLISGAGRSAAAICQAADAALAERIQRRIEEARAAGETYSPAV